MAQMNYNRFTLINCVTFFALLLATNLSWSQNRKLTQSEATELQFNSNRKSLKLWEVKTAPIALYAQWYTLDVSYLISPKFSTGPAVVIFGAQGEEGNMFAPTYKGYAVGWNGNYYFQSAYKDSIYLSGHAYYEKFKSFPHAARTYEDKNGFRANTAFGYRMKYALGSLMLGAGAEYRNHNTSVVKKSNTTGSTLSENSFVDSYWLPHIEVKIGMDI